jgi:chromate transporter
MSALWLYWKFFQIGLFSIGGGLATLPFLFQMATQYSWITPELIGNYLAIAQSCPGAVGVNMCIQAGFHAGASTGASILNGIASGLGLVSPSIIIIIIVARALEAFKTNRWVQAVFTGLRPAAAGLLAAAAFGALKVALWKTGAAVTVAHAAAGFKWKETIIFVVCLILMRKFKWHPIVYIVAAGVVGAVAGL